MSAHGSKGLQADAVVILNASDVSFGFPCQRETDPILRAVLPSTDVYEYAEERRLFYVALTRGRDHVVVCFDRGAPSAFVRELADMPGVVTVDGRPLMTKRVVCRRCALGYYVYRERKSDTKPFYGCSAPGCNEVADPCPECVGVLDVSANAWICTREECTYRAAQCPRCRRGVLRKRPGYNGTSFVGCSRYKGDDPETCKFKTNDLGALSPPARPNAHRLPNDFSDEPELRRDSACGDGPTGFRLSSLDSKRRMHCD